MSRTTTTTREYEAGELVRETVEVFETDDTPARTCSCHGWSWSYGQPYLVTAPAPVWQDNAAAVVPQAQTFTVPAY